MAMLTSKELDQITSQIEKEIKKLPRDIPPETWKAVNYIGDGCSKFIFLDIKLPVIRTRLKLGFPYLFKFPDLPKAQEFQIFHRLFLTSPIHDVAQVALFWLERNPDIALSKRKDIIRWNQKIDNWALADGLSRFLSLYLEEFPSEMTPIFKKWTVSKNPWRRRLAVVSLFFYARFRERPPPKELVEWVYGKLAQDENYYVQRGLGWSLRECQQFYPELFEKFLEKHAAHLASITWTTALEKVPSGLKERLNLKRKSRGTSRKKKD